MKRSGKTLVMTHNDAFGPDVPDWIIAEYYANGPQPYLLRLASIFTDFGRRKMTEDGLKEHLRR
jgi:hypothetical protein